MATGKAGATLAKRISSSENKKQLTFRKTNEAIGMRVSEGRLSLLTRKMFNLMVYNAQKAGVPGKDAPAGKEIYKKFFWMPMSDLARDVDYDSKDMSIIKDNFEQLLNIRIHMEDNVQWTSERLIASAKIVNPNGLNSRGGKVYFGYAFPPEVFELVMRPDTYTTLSIYYQTMLRGNASLSLYEICRRFMTNPSQVTRIEPWEWWWYSLTGNPTKQHPPEYKYFKRDTLRSAIKDINTVTDIFVDLIEHKKGTRVVNLQFKVTQKKQASLEFPAPPIINSALIDRVAKLGIAPNDAGDITAEYEEAKVIAALEYTEARLKNKRAAPIASPGAYFRNTLRGNYAGVVAIAEKSPKGPASAPPKTGPTVKERFLEQRRMEASGYFNELTDNDRDTLLLEFSDHAPKTLLKPLKQRGLADPFVRVSFLEWLALKVWGEPSDKDIIAFADKLIN